MTNPLSLKRALWQKTKEINLFFFHSRHLLFCSSQEQLVLVVVVVVDTIFSSPTTFFPLLYPDCLFSFFLSIFSNYFCVYLMCFSLLCLWFFCVPFTSIISTKHSQYTILPLFVVCSFFWPVLVSTTILSLQLLSALC